jgi:hypothetical protein
MTTPLAEKMYLAEHLLERAGRKPVVFNPHGRPVEELPRIMAFSNTVAETGQAVYAILIEALAIAEDGTVLGNHACSHEGYINNDLGVLEGCREGRHIESYRKHYPDGYRMEFVPGECIDSYAPLQEAFRLNKARTATP